jgi:hypothetical protein
MMYLIQDGTEPLSFEDRNDAIDEAKKLSARSKVAVVVEHRGERLIFERGRLKQYVYETPRKGGG